VILLAGIAVLAVVVVALYWAQSVFIPVTMAAFLALLLNPLVVWLRRHGLGRSPSVLVAVLFTACLLTIVGWMATTQISSLLKELPNYTYTMTEKIRSLKKVALGSGALSRMVAVIYDEIVLPTPPPTEGRVNLDGPTRVNPDQPPTVVVDPHAPIWLSRVATFLSPLMEFMAQLALALVLLIFMLLKREELRSRIIRLIGHGRIIATTRFVDEAGQRISRFLLMQAIVNGTVGLFIGAGLYLIGVKYALFWGMLTAILRYLPYLGPILAVAFPAVITFAMSSTLVPTLLVVGLFLAVELVVANLVEPRLYGQSTGVSEIALLISAAFWAFFWGPIGLVLSSPLTVCLVSLGRYVPQLEFLWVLLGDGPLLAPEVSFYQRLLARDEREATELVLEKLGTDGVDTVYDAMLIPALRSAKRNRQQDLIDDADLQVTLTAIEAITGDLEPRVRQARILASCDEQLNQQTSRPPIAIIGCPGHGEADRLALEMLRQLLDPLLWTVELVGPRTLVSELIDRIAACEPSLVCIANVTPGGLARTRYLSKRLRASFPDLRILVCRWGHKGGAQADPGGLMKAGTDVVTASLVETRGRLMSLRPVLAAKQKDSGPVNGNPPKDTAATKKSGRESPTTASALA
jgi:predicted PurR-regulated permease PerM